MLERYFNACHEIEKGSYREKRSGKYTRIKKDLPMPNIVWSKDIFKFIRRKFNINSSNDSQNIAIRIADCYGLFDYLLAQAESENVKKTA